MTCDSEAKTKNTEKGGSVVVAARFNVANVVGRCGTNETSLEVNIVCCVTNGSSRPRKRWIVFRRSNQTSDGQTVVGLGFSNSKKLTKIFCAQLRWEWPHPKQKTRSTILLHYRRFKWWLCHQRKKNCLSLNHAFFHSIS